MEAQNLTFLKALKCGAIAGLIGAGLNNIWSLMANAMGASIPPGCLCSDNVFNFSPISRCRDLFSASKIYLKRYRHLVGTDHRIHVGKFLPCVQHTSIA